MARQSEVMIACKRNCSLLNYSSHFIQFNLIFTEVTMKHCIAHCLDMIEPTKSINASQTPCYYNAFTGKCKFFADFSEFLYYENRN